MLARRCDRCGKFCDPYEKNEMQFNAVKRCLVDYKGRIVEEDLFPRDLCLECRKEFCQWFQNKNKN